jgi:hypothetical protein
MQLRLGIMGNRFICMVHHSASVYDEGMWDGFIVQKNNPKINREFKAAVLKSILQQRAIHHSEGIAS